MKFKFFGLPVLMVVALFTFFLAGNSYIEASGGGIGIGSATLNGSQTSLTVSGNATGSIGTTGALCPVKSRRPEPEFPVSFLATGWNITSGPSGSYSLTLTQSGTSATCTSINGATPPEYSFSFAVDISVLASGTYTINVCGEDGDVPGVNICNSASFTKGVLPPFELSCSPLSQAVAIGTSAVINGSGGTRPYGWSAPGGSPSSGGDTTSFSTSYSTTGTKTVTLTDSSAPQQSVNCTVTLGTENATVALLSGPSTLAPSAQGTFVFRVTNTGNTRWYDVSKFKLIQTSSPTTFTISPTFGQYGSTTTTGPGTVSNLAGGTTVTGSGTSFLTKPKVGDTITIGGEARTVASVASNTSLTTTTVFTTAHSSGSAYTITTPNVYTGDVRDLSFNLTAPTTSGTYTFSMRNRRETNTTLRISDTGATVSGSNNTSPILFGDTGSATFTVSSSSLPNLTASAPTPSTAVAGTALTFSSTISNIGNASTGASFSNFFQRATASQGGGTVTDLTATSMSTLAAGASATATSPSVTFTTAGTYSVRACADKSKSSSSGTITETPQPPAEDNNCSPWTNVVVSAPAPDLTAGLSSPTNATAGTALTFSATVSNIGNASTGSSFSNFFQRCNAGAQATQACTSPVDLTPSSSMGILTAGTGNNATSPSINFASAGTYSMRVCANKSSSATALPPGTGTFTESNWTNNCGPWTDVTVSAPACTLTPSFSGSVSPSSVSPGGAYTVSCDYGVISSYMSVIVGSGSCGSWLGFTGTTANWGCSAGLVPGTFSNACSITYNSAYPYCSRTDSINNLIVMLASTASISVNPTSIFQGNSATLTWSSTDAASCTGTNFNTGGLTSDSLSVSPLSTITYTVTCGSAQASATLTVKKKPGFIEN